MDIGIRADGLTTSDFEEFALEIVKKKFNNTKLHGFKEGKDDGIDGIDDVLSPTLLIQAKRWQVTKSHTTAVSLLKDEIKKVSINKETKYGWNTNFRYVIVTSMGLSPDDLKKVREYANEILPGSMPSDEYILFSSTLTMMSKDIEFRNIFENYGLVEKNISRVLRKERLNSIEAESKSYFKGFDFNFFVETDFLGRAYQNLQKEHILLIQGPAGIGKTTTCTMLGNLLLNNEQNEFDVIVRKVEDIDRVLRLYNTNYKDVERNLFVIFDDFLGRNKFDVNERILLDIKKLYSASKYTNNLFICLNSRTQIIQDAKLVNFEFQKLISEDFTEGKNFIIDLEKYSSIDKAHIFRKAFERKLSVINQDAQHELSGKYEVLRTHKWNRIINHRNFFPRSIELITNNFEDSNENFYDYVLFTLDHPVKLYTNLFDNLKIEEKYILFSILLFKDLPVKEESIKRAFNTLDLSSDFNFEKALQKLDGSWITSVKNKLVGETKIDFLNPSIIDFLNDKIEKLTKMKEKIIRNAIYLDQICNKGNRHLGTNMELADVDFFKRLLNNWDIFEDNEYYIGEKLTAIIKLEKFDDNKGEFLKLLGKYDGSWRMSKYYNGWSRVISEIYYSDNDELKQCLINSIENPVVMESILSSNYLDLDILDEIVSYLDTMVDGLSYGIFSDKKYNYEFTEMDIYFKFRDKKISLLQDFLDDDEAEVDDGVDVESEEFNSSTEVERQLKRYTEKINVMLSSGYNWADIDAKQLDYSGLEDNITSNLKNMSYHISYSDDAYDLWRESQIEVDIPETIEDILDKPLL
ncbi:ATP-binding protein [Latilactobacillus sakei]|uniref:ATP-binding protein n=1 Tax=Latilactobacillus sakei TaxID=1599 RepID=UPI003F53A99C